MCPLSAMTHLGARGSWPSGGTAWDSSPACIGASTNTMARPRLSVRTPSLAPTQPQERPVASQPFRQAAATRPSPTPPPVCPNADNADEHHPELQTTLLDQSRWKLPQAPQRPAHEEPAAGGDSTLILGFRILEHEISWHR